MKAVNWLTVVILSAPLVADAQSPQATAGPQQPNIILVMTDDQGQWAMGCYGNKDIHTANLDRLAADGARFVNAFATTPVCSPSRATFVTGLIPSQHGIHDWIKNENVGPRARCMIADKTSLDEVLAKGGYVCGLSGKWHLGHSLHRQKSYSYWFTIPGGSGPYQDADIVWDGKIQKSKGYITDLITEHALDFIEQQKDRRFFLNIQYTAPHGPWAGHPEKFTSLYKDSRFESIPKDGVHPNASASKDQIGKRETLIQYFAAVSGVDDAVGRIVARLDALGLREKTLVIFASDQGFQCGHNGLWGKGNASNPRNMYEESVKIPLIFNHPGRIPPGQVRSELVSAYDFMPTVLGYAGLVMPQGRYAGKSYAPVLEGKSLSWSDRVFGEYGRARMLRTAEWKLVHRADGGPDELYQISKDPKEDHNLIDVPEHRKQFLQMRQELDGWFDEHSEGDADPVGNEYHKPETKPK